MSVPAKALQSIERRPEFADILREDEGFSTGEQGTAESAVNNWFDKLVQQSGLDITGPVLLGLCMFMAILFGGPVFLLLDMPLPALVFAIFGAVVPLVVASFFRSRRQSQIMEQLPLVAEEMARFARTGRNLEDAFTAVALDTPAPLGKELLTCVRRTEMGLDIASAVKDLPETTGVSTLAMLTSAISVNQETGGDLIQVLERLSAAVRDRLHFVSRQRSATISSRLVAGMMLLIPFFVIGFFVSRDVNYMNQLLSSESGRYSFWTGVVLQVLGALIVVRILRRTSRF